MVTYGSRTGPAATTSNRGFAGRGLPIAIAATTERIGARAARRSGQRGSASLIGLALCGFLVIATLVTVDVGALAFARARAQTAADLAALAAVTPYPAAPLAAPGGAPSGLIGGLGSPAGRAGAIAASNGADVLACSCGPLETTIGVGVRARLIPFGTTVRVRAYARAVLRSSTAPSATRHAFRDRGIAGRAGTSAGAGVAARHAALHGDGGAGLAPPTGDGARPGGRSGSTPDQRWFVATGRPC
jgi:hypothetical protein